MKRNKLINSTKRGGLFTRRRFVTTAGLAAAAMTTGVARAAGSQAPARVSQDDPMAKALNYVHDARSVDAAKRFSNRYCNNCALYVGNADDKWAKCGIFPGKVVAGRGWCSAWAAK